MSRRNWLILLIALPLAAVCFYGFDLVLIAGHRGDILAIAGFLLSVAFLYGAGYLLSLRARRLQVAGRVLDQLEQAVLLNLPLPRALGALAADLNLGKDKPLAAIAAELEFGQPLARVLECHTALPQKTVRTLALAEQSGQLDRVAPVLARQRRSAMAQRVRSGGFYRTYPLLVVTLLLGVVNILQIFIGPKFQQIFKDFHEPLPWLTRMTMVTGSGGNACVFLVFVLVLILWLCRIVSAGQGDGLQQSRLTRLLQWLPLIGRPRRDDAWAEALAFMADALSDERALFNSLQTASELSRSARVRSQLRDWLVRLEQGQAIDQAAHGAGLPALIVGLLGTHIETASLVDVLRFAADYYHKRAQQFDAWVDLAITPAVALSMGFLVAWVALAVFLPLTRLIDVTNARALVVR